MSATFRAQAVASALGSERHGAVGKSVAHDSAHLHVRGAATYIDDILEPRGTAYAALTTSPIAHGLLKHIDLNAALASEGVIAAYTAADIPGANQYGAITHDEPFLAEGKVEFVGQPVAVVVARSMREARVAARKVRCDIEALPPILSIEAALAANSLFKKLEVVRGEPSSAFANAAHRTSGAGVIGAQEHFYLEGQIALAVPLEDGQMHVYVSTQHPTEMQQVTATILGIDWKDVISECRRLGGGFGGKEVQPAQFVAIAALAARLSNRPVKLRLDRDDDFMITGKRHDFAFDYNIAFDDGGRIEAYDLTLSSRCGFSTDYSHQVNDRAMCHIDNGYSLTQLRLRNYRCKTNTQSATAFRGFGAPQGAFATEHAIESIARALGKDSLDVRKANFYSPERGMKTHYGQAVDGFWLPDIVNRLEASCDYRTRREAIREHNAKNPFVKRGLALTPVMFGISFNASFLNRGSALVSLYLDGSLLVNHAGTEMGQGLFIKVQQVVAHEFGVAADAVRSTSTNTAKLPNTSPTAASSGSDLNGMAALDACTKLKERLIPLAAKLLECAPADVVFRNGGASTASGIKTIDLKTLATRATFAKIPLTAQGFYYTPNIAWNGDTFEGTPAYYFAYGAACAEVKVDTLTGEHKTVRVDILHDVGNSLNPAIDRGQIEGGFVQGMGYLTSEELVWDEHGRLRTHAPSTYKIPTAADVPEIFNVALYEEPNHVPTIHRSKAVGEPPLTLAFSVWFAIADAISSISDRREMPALAAPATPEAVLRAINALKQ
ncbi:MAG: xanthine dehydrogenase molybdopterin binding subunit [Betaproteobacteria bacterium]|nr:MAG: xanthine dehydrogenase molybdopterin binding subunit [Betaproteobacteria bacterium]